MTLHLHDYGRTGVGAGGAPINYAEVSRLLLAERSLAPRAHDFFALVAGGGERSLAGLVRDGDTLVCTAGPYAHLYHYWRERTGIDFRIVRDAHTTAWAPYLAQEWLAGPMVREGDTIVFPSEFTRSFYARAFPHVTAANSRVLYPLAEHLPAARPHAPGRRLRIGCLGRIADDKNLPDAMSVAARVRRERPAELHLAGPFYPASSRVGSRAALLAAAREAGLPADAVTYHGDLAHERIWDFLARIDVLFFPAVSSNESFGRVIAEADHAGVAVVATDYAAAPELLPRANLVEVRYHAVSRARLSLPFSLGAPDRERAAEAILAGPRHSGAIGGARYSKAAFLRMVSGDDAAEAALAPQSAGARRFLDRASLAGVAPLAPGEAIERCAAQLDFMRLLNHESLGARVRAVTRIARHFRGDPVVRRVARERLAGKLSPGVLRNAVATGRHVGFDPRLSLAAG